MVEVSGSCYQNAQYFLILPNTSQYFPILQVHRRKSLSLYIYIY
jgi:hypothetical protein